MKSFSMSRILQEEVFATSAGATFDDLESSPVPFGHMLKVTHMSVENRTTGYTRLVTGVKKGSSFKQKEEEKNPVADTIYWSRSEIWISGGSTFCCRMTGCTNLDELVLNVEGVLFEMCS